MRRAAKRRAAKAASLALVALAAAGALALLAYFNALQWAVNATLAPISKNLNQSLYPLARAWYQYSGPYNVTYYYVKFMPGWPETYTVGIFAARDAGWQARLIAQTRLGNPGGTYSISLGGQAQITNTQDAGPYVSAPAPLTWSMATTGRYSILAVAQFNKGGIYAVQLVNFTAEPMSKLASWTFSCPGYTYTQQYTCSGGTSTATLPVYYVVDVTSCPPKGQLMGAQFSPYCTTDAVGGYSQTAGPKVVLTDNGYYRLGYLVWGQVPSGHNTVYARFEFWTGGGTGADAVWFGIYDSSVTNGNYGDTQNTAREDIVTGGYHFTFDEYTGNSGTPSGPRIAFTKSTQDNGPPIAGVAVPRNYFMNGQWHKAEAYLYIDDANNRVQGWSRLDLGYNGYQYTGTDASPQPNALSRAGYFYIGGRTGAATNWHLVRNVYVVFLGSVPVCSPSMRTWTVGSSSAVYVRGDNGRLAEVASAYGSSYGVAAAFVDYAFNATGASISTTAVYHFVYSARNNVVYVDVAVDENYDGSPDREYIYYYYDTADANGVIVSPFTQATVCTVDSAGNCNPSDARYVVYKLGSASPGQQLPFSITLNAKGAVTSIALVVTNGNYAAQPITRVFAEWDPVTVKSYSCPLPAGWSAQGAYVWQTNYALFVANSATAYTQLVQGALTYVANFTGTGKYVALTSTLGEAFGLYLRGSSAGCVYGFYSPTSQWVELRPLAALGDVIARDSAGNVLARFGCAAPPAAQYIGFRAGPGEYLIVRTVEAWG